MSKAGKIIEHSFYVIAVGVIATAMIVGMQTKGPRYVPHECERNLFIINSAKDQWATENHRTTSDIPTWDDLQPYLPKHLDHATNGVWFCPAGGYYTLGRVGDSAKCSIGGPGHTAQVPP
jgi:hypothetical protein